MTCEEVRKLLHPFFDDELDVVAHVQVEQHLAECGDCASEIKELRSLRTALSAAPLYHRAPASLRARLQQGSIELPVASARGRTSYARFAALAAGILLLISASAITAVYWSRARAGDDRFSDLVVAAHVRSLQAKHATDVASMNQHTVKPWFEGKLDFAPQVPDLSEHGYSLSGGRLDYLLDRPVAAIVYYRGMHPINVFTWPAMKGDDEPMRKIMRQGFQIDRWEHAGMTYWAISDISAHDLDEFVRLFQEQAPMSSR